MRAGCDFILRDAAKPPLLRMRIQGVRCPEVRAVFGEPRRMASEGACCSSFEARKGALLRMTGM
jgi:hypothetical protein